MNVLTFYVKPPARVLDPMCGNKHFYQLLTDTLDGDRYEMIYGDLKPTGDYRGSAFQLPFRDRMMDAVVYDPSFTDSDVLARNQEVFGVDHLDAYVGTKDLPDLHAIHAQAAPEITRVLKRSGIMIVKMYDRHVDSVLHLEHACLLQFFPRFVLRDMVIFRTRKVLGFRSKAFGKFHAYFLVLQKR